MLSKEAQEARREYQRQWREKNRDKYNNYMRTWRKNNPEKVQQYEENFWNKVAAGDK